MAFWFIAFADRKEIKAARRLIFSVILSISWLFLEFPAMAEEAAIAKEELIYVIVVTDPPGANLKVDMQSHGKTPAAVKLKPGKEYTINIEIEGYLTFEEKFTFKKSGQRLSLELEPLKSDERGTIYPWEAEKGKVSDPDQADKDCELPENIFRSGKTLFLGLNLGVELFPIFDELGYSISPTFELGAVVNPHLSITLEMYSEVYILFNLAFVLKSTFYFQRGNSAYIVAGIGYGCVLQANVGFGYEWFIGDSGAVGISLRYDPLIVDEQEAIHQAGLFVTFRYYL